MRWTGQISIVGVAIVVGFICGRAISGSPHDTESSVEPDPGSHRRGLELFGSSTGRDARGSTEISLPTAPESVSVPALQSIRGFPESVDCLKGESSPVARVPILLRMLEGTNPANVASRSVSIFSLYRNGQLREEELSLLMEGCGKAGGLQLLECDFFPELPPGARLAALRGWAGGEESGELLEFARSSELFGSLGLSENDVIKALVDGSLDANDKGLLASVSEIFDKPQFISTISGEQMRHLILQLGFAGGYDSYRASRAVAGEFDTVDSASHGRAWILLDEAARVGPAALLSVIEKSAGEETLDKSIVVAGAGRLAAVDIDTAIEFATGSSDQVRPYALNRVIQEWAVKDPGAALDFIGTYEAASTHEQINILLGLETATQNTHPEIAQQCVDLRQQLDIEFKEELARKRE